MVLNQLLLTTVCRIAVVRAVIIIVTPPDAHDAFLVLALKLSVLALLLAPCVIKSSRESVTEHLLYNKDRESAIERYQSQQPSIH